MDNYNGLNEKQVVESRKTYGTNEIKKVRQILFYQC